MSGDVIGWIVGVLAALAGLFGLYAKGRRDGTKNEQIKQDAANAIAEQKRADSIAKAKEVGDRVDAMSDSDAERRLRDKYTRD